MSAVRLGETTAIRLAALGALAAFCAFHWANLVVSPPVGRVALVVAIAATTAWGLDRLASEARPGALRALAALVIAGVGICAGLVAAGLPPRLLAPGNWGELRAGLADGIGAIGNVSYPYDGQVEWGRRVLLLALPALLGLGAALAFWPARRRQRLLRGAGLGILVATYGLAAVLYAPDAPLAHGLILFVLIAAWLWAPRLPRRRLAVAGAAVVAAGALAVPVAGTLDRSSPLLNYRDWTWAGAEPKLGFNWTHSYGSLDWPREGTPLLEIRSESPHYWRAAVLERFDGFGWLRADAIGSALELPNRVEGLALPVHREWFETTEVTVRELRTGLVVGPGSIQNLSGLQGSIGGDGTALAGEIPSSGATYEVVSYAPDPTVEEMRAAPAAYASTLARFTVLELPRSRSGAAGGPGAVPVPTPLRGAEPMGSAWARAERLFRASGYGGVYALARRLTDGSPTTYDAVKAVERHLQRGFTYTESPPPAGSRPLSSFLLDGRAGYCQHFSGAMALMLRMTGIPARVVSGFSPGAPDAESKGTFTVLDTDAHSWVEVYFTGIGWVPFDPTPGASPASSQTGLAAAAATPGDIPGGPDGLAREREPGTGGAAGIDGDAGGGGFPWALLAATAVLSAALALALAVRRRLRYAALGPAARAQAQLNELAGALERIRFRTDDGTTLLALERRLRRGARPAAADYAARLRACRFAPAPARVPGLDARRVVRRELARTRGLRGRLRALATIPPGGPAARAARPR
jgi:protein-glutamine gamma-glutamyltransferase